MKQAIHLFILLFFFGKIFGQNFTQKHPVFQSISDNHESGFIDLNNDGKKDFVCFGCSSQLQDSASFTFSENFQIGLTKPFYRYYAYDVNQDGWQDIIAHRWASDGFAVYLNQQTEPFIINNPIWSSSLKEDINRILISDRVVNDRSVHFLVDNNADGEVNLFEYHADDTIKLIKTFVFKNNIRKLEWADINQDGQDDILALVSESRSGKYELLVSLNTGNYNFSELSPFYYEESFITFLIDSKENVFLQVEPSLNTAIRNPLLKLNFDQTSNTFSVIDSFAYYDDNLHIERSQIDFLDVDQDGLEDIVESFAPDLATSVNKYAKVEFPYYFKNNGQGFERVSFENRPAYLYENYGFLDIDGNGVNELVTKDISGRLRLESIIEMDADGGVPGKDEFFPYGQSGSKSYFYQDLDQDGLTDWIIYNAAEQTNYFVINEFDKNIHEIKFKKLANNVALRELAVLDFNQDGAKDIVGHSVHNHWMLELVENRLTEENRFAFRQQIHAGVYLENAEVSILINDLTNDGLEDIFLFAERNNSQYLIYFENDGQGSFKLPVRLLEYSDNRDFIYNLNIYDIDRDGLPDLMYQQRNRFYYRINMGNGNLGSQTLAEFDFEFTVRAVVAGDMFGEKNIFIASGPAPTTDTLFYNRFDAGQQKFVPGNIPLPIEIRQGGTDDVEIVDIDLDGDLDYVEADKGSINDGNLTLGISTDSGLRVESHVLAEGYDLDDFWLFFNDQGSLAFIFDENLKNDLLLKDSGTGKFERVSIVEQAHNINDFRRESLIDLDQDGDLDVLITGSYNQIFLKKNNGQGKFSRPLYVLPTEYRERGLSDNALIADLDEDGNLDLIFSSKIFFNQGLSIENPENFLVEKPFSSGSTVGFGHMNMDDHLDLLVQKNDVLKVIETSGDREIIEREYSVGNNVAFIEVYDVNDDGLNDVIARSEYDFDCSCEFLEAHINNGNQTFTDSGLLFQGDQQETIEFSEFYSLSDVNGDGYRDFIWLKKAGIEINLYDPVRKAFSKSYLAGVNVNDDSGAPLVATDYDLDGDTDLIYRNEIFLNTNGKGNFERANTRLQINYSDDLIVVGAGDIDGDGKIDLLRQNGWISHLDLFPPAVELTADLVSARAFADAVPVNNNNSNLDDVLLLDDVSAQLFSVGSNRQNGEYRKLQDLDLPGVMAAYPANLQDQMETVIFSQHLHGEEFMGVLKKDSTVWRKMHLTGQYDNIIVRQFASYQRNQLHDLNQNGYPDILMNKVFRQDRATQSIPQLFEVRPKDNFYSIDVSASLPASFARGTSSSAANHWWYVDLDQDGSIELLEEYKGYYYKAEGDVLLADSLPRQINDNLNRVIDVTDYEGDGDLDVVFRFELLLNDQNKMFNSVSGLTEQSGLFFDVNRDGFSDQLILQGINGRWETSAHFQDPATGKIDEDGYRLVQTDVKHKILFHDMDNDGDEDLLVVAGSEVFWLENDLIPSVFSGRLRVRPYYDENENRQLDVGEPILPNQNVLVEYTDHSQNYLTDASGTLVTLHPDSANIISVRSRPEWVLSTNPGTVEIFASDSISVVDFGFKPGLPLDSVLIDINLLSSRCSENSKIIISVLNSGNTGQDGEIEIRIPSEIVINDFSQTPARTEGEKYYFIINDFGPTDRWNLIVDVLMPGAESTGEIFPIGLTFNDVAAEKLIGENHYPVLIRCSYDPNDKAVFPNVPNTVDNPTLIGSQLNYKIRFQNTGNDYARNVRITDRISPLLDLSTLQVLSSSHSPMQTFIAEDRTVIFQFDNINLPDSTTDFNGSQGFVSFVILPHDSLPDPVKVTNEANIYFDFNPPILTNKTITTFTSDLISSVERLNDAYSCILNRIFPNPNDGTSISISLSSYKNFTLAIFNATGQQLDFIRTSGNQLTYPVGHLSSGSYYVRLIDLSSGKACVGKFIIQ